MFENSFMKRTILLYNPKAVFFDMPLALISIGTQVQEEFDVVIIDSRIEEDVIGKLKKNINQALLVGVTSLTGAPLKDAIWFTKMVKELSPNVPIVWGGWHTSLFPERILKDVPEIDIVVHGQGEVTFKELVTSISEGKPLKNVDGIVFREDDNSIQKTPPRAMHDMNELPRLNYDLIDVEKYFQAKGNRQFDFITSIGCFFRCTFCADPFVFNRKYNGLLPDRIVSDLVYYHKKYDFDDVNFQDETFFTYSKRIVQMSESLEKYGTKFSWAATMRADQGSRMSKEEFVQCKKGGLRRLLIGVESGSQEMMDWLKKDIKVEQVLLCAERCKELDIGVIFPFIVGFPKESDASIEATKKMISRLALMSPAFKTPIFYFKPYPGTQITNEVVASGEYTMPSSIEEWAEFDYVGSRGPWVSEAKFQDFEKYKFYLKVLARKRNPFNWPLTAVAKYRVKNQAFKLAIDKKVVELFIKEKKLS